MVATKEVEVYEIREVFQAPLAFAYRWCTDYTEEDGSLSKEGNARQILRKSGRQVVYEDLTPSPEGWKWSRYAVTLHPPDRWTAVARGNYRAWKLVYTLRSLSEGRTELHLRGERRPVHLGKRNPSHRELEGELHRMWGNFGRAMARDYQASRARRTARR